MAQAEARDLSGRLAALEERLTKLEKRRGETGVEPLLRTLFPAEVRQHLRAAQKEQLLAARAFIDHWIERAERGAAERPRRRGSIRVE